MYFKTLKERMEYFKSLTDYRLTPNSYVLCHIDGKNFSYRIKKLFKLPFDNTFINMINQSAIYACQNIQGCKLAYVQSDEISLAITDFDNDNTDSFYGFRLCKMQSIIASLVTSKFQQLFTKNFDRDDLFQFDCKCWTVPTYNDVFAWIKYRQNDCIRNSKQQASQTYCKHKELLGKNTDEQIELLKEKVGIDWHDDYSDGQKYGRLIYKTGETFISEYGTEYERNIWSVHDLKPLTRDNFDELKIIPIR